jgi:hypothetical protein
MSDSEDTTFALAPPIDREAERKAKRAARNKAWREANQERLKAYAAGRRAIRAAYMRERRAANPDYQAEAKAYRERTKAHIKAWHKAHYEDNKGEINARHKTHYEENKGEINTRRRCQYHATPLIQKSRALLKRYGLTIEQYEGMYHRCSGRCECCKVPFSRVIRTRPNVDHCHATNRVRGLICHRCNIALGCVDDNPKILRALARYLERQGKDNHAVGND